MDFKVTYDEDYNLIGNPIITNTDDSLEIVRFKTTSEEGYVSIKFWVRCNEK